MAEYRRISAEVGCVLRTLAWPCRRNQGKQKSVCLPVINGKGGGGRGGGEMGGGGGS